MSKFLISCGGTGGHLAPGIAVGEALCEQGHEVTFVISQKVVDTRIVKKYSQFKFIKVPGCGFSFNPIKLAKFIAAQASAVSVCKKLFSETNADAAISFGGFNSFGLGVAALILKKPLILHEANRKAGRAVRFFGEFARRVYVPYGVEISRKRSGVVRQAGYPIRSEIKRVEESAAKSFFGFSKDANILLVCGGSQGAAALNEWAYKNFETLANEGIDIFCITGPGKMANENLKTKDKSGGIRELRSIEFCENMAEAMSCARVVVARAGAGSIAEFARCKVIPLLVPFPHSADNHQIENARFVERSGAGICIMQNNLGRLDKEVLELMRNDNLRAKMVSNLALLDEHNSITKLISDIEDIAKKAEKIK